MSVACPTAEPAAPRAPRGFTLLELVVVLSILGLVAALAAPSLLRSLDAWRGQAAMDALVEQIRGLPGRARAMGQPVTVDTQHLAGDAPVLVVDGLSLTIEEAWTVSANGYCEGGRLHIASDRWQREVEVRAPFCEPRIMDAR